MKLNNWTTEFRWQEGHTCHATEADVEELLDAGVRGRPRLLTLAGGAYADVLVPLLTSAPPPAQEEGVDPLRTCRSRQL